MKFWKISLQSFLPVTKLVESRKMPESGSDRTLVVLAALSAMQLVHRQVAKPPADCPVMMISVALEKRPQYLSMELSWAMATLCPLKQRLVFLQQTELLRQPWWPVPVQYLRWKIVHSLYWFWQLSERMPSVWVQVSQQLEELPSQVLLLPRQSSKVWLRPALLPHHPPPSKLMIILLGKYPSWAQQAPKVPSRHKASTSSTIIFLKLLAAKARVTISSTRPSLQPCICRIFYDCLYFLAHQTGSFLPQQDGGRCSVMHGDGVGGSELYIVNLNIGNMVQTIPEMHKHLQQLNQFFNQTTSQFVTVISAHPGKFTNKDFQEYGQLIEDIRTQAMTRIADFFNTKFEAKCELYDSKITSFTESGENIQEQLNEFRLELEQATVDLKKEQNRKENLLDSFSKKYSEHIILKRAWKLLEENRKERQKARELDRKMDAVYRKNLYKKAFFPWRTLTYKEGYENTVRRETEKDIMGIHEHYQSIIDILKNKIIETDDMIKVKRAAKGEFAFALSKNLLKTISNLSLEMMSLNQMSLRDGECQQGETRKFMKTVDNVINEKLGKVREYRRNLLGEGENEDGEDKKRKKKITFL